MSVPINECLISLKDLIMNMKTAEANELRRAEAAALKVLLKQELEVSNWLVAEAYGMHRAYGSIVRELERLNIRLRAIES